MYKLLTLGGKIVIKAENCLSTVFWITDGVLHSYNKALGDMIRTDMTAEKFNAHCERIVSEGGEIEVHTYTNTQAEILREV